MKRPTKDPEDIRLINSSDEEIYLRGIGDLCPDDHVDLDPYFWDDLDPEIKDEIDDLVQLDCLRREENQQQRRVKMPQQERDVVLWPGQYCYILSRTSGNISTYVGPKTETLDDNKRLVVFDEDEKEFTTVHSLEEAIQTFHTAPEGWYAVLKNPSKMDHDHPQEGEVYEKANLAVGQKVNIPGNKTFGLFPGQMVRIIQGHQLRSNQYLVCRVYNEEAAKASLESAILKPQTEDEEGTERKDLKLDPDDMTTGNLIIIRGTDFSFFIPPTGIEVVKEGDGYVREAVTLEQLEYCVMLDEDGNKEYLYGPNVVFPKPTQKFLTKEGPSGDRTRKFRCIELNHLQGIYAKVIAPYTDENGVDHEIGEELFITGGEDGQRIFYPRPEIAIIRYGDSVKHYAIAIPPGEARYSLDRDTGKISVVEGPKMWLPDPRVEVPIRRALSGNQVDLLYPGNQEAKQYNAQLASMMEGGSDFVTERAFVAKSAAPTRSVNLTSSSVSSRALLLNDQHIDYEQASTEVMGDEFRRSAKYTRTPSITLDTKYEGAVTVDVWNNYAMLLVRKSTGERRVVVGPKTILLNYDENPEVLKLSKGKPKGSEPRIKTVYLRVKQNRVSDIIKVQTADLVDCAVRVIHQLDFEGEDSEKWFDVEDYVKFITDNCRSRLRNAVKKLGIEEFHANYIDIVRNTILGAQEDGKRTGRYFEENACRIYEVDVLDLEIGNAEIRDLLVEAQRNTVRDTLELRHAQQQLELTREREKNTREAAQFKSATVLRRLELESAEKEAKDQVTLAELERHQQREEKQLQDSKIRAELQQQITEAVLAYKKLDDDFEASVEQRRIDQSASIANTETEAYVKRASAIQQGLIEALQTLARTGMAKEMVENLGVASYLQGESVYATLQRLFAGSGFEQYLPKPPSNGSGQQVSTLDQPALRE